MTITFTVDAHGHQALWRAAVYDPGMAVGVLMPGRSGRMFADTIAELLMQSGLLQPTPIERTRAVTRQDAGRLQVALQRASRDITIVNAERLTPVNAHLLALCSTRAGVNLHLIAEDTPSQEVLDWAAAYATTVAGDALLADFQQRPSAERRLEVWDCHPALRVGADTVPACAEHATATECVLAWFPHAIATSRTAPYPVRMRLHELTQLAPDTRWDIWAHARDTYLGARAAAGAAGIPGPVYKAACIDDLATDASTLTVNGHTYLLNGGPRLVIGTQRDIKVAEGLPGRSKLFAVREAGTDRYLRSRPGDPVPRILEAS
jgi:hypothetical protein